MNDSADDLDASLEDPAAAAEEWRGGLVTLSQTLREMQKTMTPAKFETLAMVTAALDRETLADFLAFDGDLVQVTDRLLEAMRRVVSALSYSQSDKDLDS